MDQSRASTGNLGVRLILQPTIWRRESWKGIPLPNGFYSSHKWWIYFAFQREWLSPGHTWHIDSSGSWHKLSKNVRNESGIWIHTLKLPSPWLPGDPSNSISSLKLVSFQSPKTNSSETKPHYSCSWLKKERKEDKEKQIKEIHEKNKCCVQNVHWDRWVVSCSVRGSS